MSRVSVTRGLLEENRFGVRCARADDISVDSLPDVLGFCADHAIELLIARCPASEPRTAQALEDAGLRLMDTLVHYSRDLRRSPPDHHLHDARVRVFQRGDEEGLRAVAADAFADYIGHYHADQRLDRAACDAAYVDWAVRSPTDPTLAGAVLLAIIDGRPAGFGTFQSHHRTRCDLRLGGIATWGRGQGLYQAISAGGMLWAHDIGAEEYCSSTQIGNLGAQKVWVRLGMEPTGAMYTFHGWFARSAT